MNYAKNRDQVKARVHAQRAIRRAAVRDLLLEYLHTHPCVDCGETDAVVLEFDHIGAKTIAVSELLNGGHTWQRVRAEIDQCVVRCANCHRLKTAHEQGFAAIVEPTQELPRKVDVVQMQIAPALGARRCRVCGLEKPLLEFPFRSLPRQTRQWICLACQRAYTKLWYERNRARHIGKVRLNNVRRRSVLKLRVQEARAEVACVDCGEANPLLLDFDHLRDKSADMSTLVHKGSPWHVVAAEINKCEVRCANCHRRKTARELGWFRASES